MDTLAVTKHLISAGVPERQAEAHVQVLTEVTEDLVTKADLQRAVKEIEQMMERRFAEMEARLAWRVVGAMVGLTAIYGMMLTVALAFFGGG